MIDPSLVGSPTDVATFLLVLWFGVRTRSRIEDLGAGVVALARPRSDVDDDRLQAELDVDDRDVDQLVRECVDQEEV